MDAAKDADEERDFVHAKRLVRAQEVSAEKRRRSKEEESAKLAARLEEEENDKLLAARLLQEEREYEVLQAEKKERQEAVDCGMADKLREEMEEVIRREEKDVEAGDAMLARRLLREEKDALLAVRMIESDKLAMRAQQKIEERDFEAARALQDQMEGEQKREESEAEGRDRMVARSYEIKDMRTNHREKRKRIWLDKIAALYLWAEDNTNASNAAEEKKGDDEDGDFMTMDEFRLCNDFNAWQDASMEIHDVMAGICVSARLPGLAEVDFAVGESGKEVELHCTSVKKGGNMVRLVHKNVEAYYGMMASFKKSMGLKVGEESEGYDIEPISTYSIHLQLDACLGVGVTKKDISYVYCDDSGVLFVYLNGLKLRGGGGGGAGKGGEEGAKKPIDRSNSIFKRMVQKIPWGSKK